MKLQKWLFALGKGVVEWRFSRSLQSRVVATHILGQVELAKRCTLLCVFPGKKTIQPNQTRVRNPDPILASLSSLYFSRCR